jgi:predicted nucleic acid-binding protein
VETGRKKTRTLVDNIYLIDACALIAYLNNEEGGTVVQRILREAALGKNLIYMHKVNFLEAYYDHKRNPSAPKKDFYEIINDYPIEFIEDLDKPLFDQIVHLKSNYKISLADSFLLATAILQNATVITSDHHEMDIVEKSGLIKFLWIR